MNKNLILKEYIKRIISKQINEIHYEDIRVSRGWKEFFAKYGSLDKIKKLGYDIDDLYVNFNSHANDKMDKRINYSPDTGINSVHNDPGGLYAYPLDYIISHPLSNTYGFEYPYMRVLLNKSKGDNSNGGKNTLNIDDVNDVMMVRDIMIKAAKLMPSVYGGYDILFEDKDKTQMEHFYENIMRSAGKSYYGYEDSANRYSYPRFLYFLLKKNVSKILDRVKESISKEYEGTDHVDDIINQFYNALFSSPEDRLAEEYREKVWKLSSGGNVSSKDMNTVLRKLGFGVLETKETNVGKAIIPDEPAQAIFLDRKSFDILDVYQINNPKSIKKWGSAESQEKINERYARILKKMVIYIFGKDVFMDRSNVKILKKTTSHKLVIDLGIKIKNNLGIRLRTNNNDNISSAPDTINMRTKYKFDKSDKYTANANLVFEVYNLLDNDLIYRYELGNDQKIESALPMIKHDYTERMKMMEKDNNAP
jgi:hypothetical protein